MIEFHKLQYVIIKRDNNEVMFKSRSGSYMMLPVWTRLIDEAVIYSYHETVTLKRKLKGVYSSPPYHDIDMMSWDEALIHSIMNS